MNMASVEQAEFDKELGLAPEEQSEFDRELGIAPAEAAEFDRELGVEPAKAQLTPDIGAPSFATAAPTTTGVAQEYQGATGGRTIPSYVGSRALSIPQGVALSTGQMGAAMQLAGTLGEEPPQAAEAAKEGTILLQRYKIDPSYLNEKGDLSGEKMRQLGIETGHEFDVKEKIQILEALRKQYGKPKGKGVVSSFLETAGKAVEDYSKKASDFYAVPDPDALSALGNLIGGSAVYMLPGMGVSSASVMLKAAPSLAAWFGTGATSMIQAGMEAGRVYQEAKAKGMSDAEAQQTGYDTFYKNAALLMVTNRLGGVFGPMKGMAKRLAAESGTNAIENGIQEVMKNIALKDPAFQNVPVAVVTGAIATLPYAAARGMGEAPRPKGDEWQQRDIGAMTRQERLATLGKTAEGMELPVRPSGEQVVAPTDVAGAKTAAPEAKPPERRMNLAKRKRVEEMGLEEARQQLLTDTKTGLASAYAFEDAPKRQAQMFFDIDGLKYINENFGYAGGDALLRTIADAARQAGVEAYRIGGDEFRGQADNVKTLENQAQTMYNILRGKKLIFESPDGKRYAFTNVGFSYGITEVRPGEDARAIGIDSQDAPDPVTARAVEALHQHKAERERLRLRGARGERPPGLSEVAPAGEQIGENRVGTEAPETAAASLVQPVTGVVGGRKIATGRPAGEYEPAKTAAEAAEERAAPARTAAEIIAQKPVEGPSEAPQGQVAAGAAKATPSTEAAEEPTFEPAQQAAGAGGQPPAKPPTVTAADASPTSPESERSQARVNIPTDSPEAPGATKAQAGFDKMDSDIKRRFGFSWKKASTGFLHKWLDTGTEWKLPLLKDPKAQDVIMYHDLHRGASGEALEQLSEAKSEVFKDFPLKDVKTFGQYLAAKRIVELAGREGLKHPIKPEDAQAWLTNLQKQNPQEYELFEKTAPKSQTVYQGQLDQLVDEGMMTPALRDKLVAEQPWYNPRMFIQHIDPEGVSADRSGRIVQAHDSGIKALDTGSEEALVTNPVFLMGQVISRTQSRIFKNRANKALYDYVSGSPDNPLGVKVDTPSGTDKSGQPTYSEVPTGYTRVFSMKDGTRQAVLMPNEIAKAWVSQEPMINEKFANVIGWVSGAKLLKPVATGYNPAFIVTNTPRDMAHVLFSTRAYNPVAPIGVAQLAKDMIEVLPDVVMRKGRVRDYVRQGGSMEFLSNQGQWRETGREALSPMGNVGKALHGFAGYLGETSELLTRMALRERGLKRGMTPEQATHLARNYLDFSQGGSWAKAVDKGLPYFNAGIQGTRGVFRAFRENPGVATFKTAQIVAIGAALAYWNKEMNEECWESISDREKAGKWIITTPFTYTDKSGEKRYVYIGIAKDQGQAIIAGLGELLAGKMNGEKVNPDRLWMALDNLTPVDQQTLFSMPLLAATGAYYFNKDFWLNDEVWKGRVVSPSEEYTVDTPKPWVKLGEMSKELKDKLGLPEVSPERAKRAASKIIPEYNPFVGLLGGGLGMIMKELPAKERDEISKPLLARLAMVPVLNRMVRTTWPTGSPHAALLDDAAKLHVVTTDETGKDLSVPELRKRIREAKVNLNDKRINLDRKFDLLAMNVVRDPTTQQELETQIASLKKTDPAEHLRIMSRLKQRWEPVWQTVAEPAAKVKERKRQAETPHKLMRDRMARRITKEEYDARMKVWRAERMQQFSPSTGE